jgi:DNA-binding XRE family transcriptional regulator
VSQNLPFVRHAKALHRELNTLVCGTLVFARVTIGFVRRPNVALGRVIARLREAAGISQEELAERAGVHRTYISQLERGIKSPTLNILVKVSGSLGVRASELIRLMEKEADELPRP